MRSEYREKRLERVLKFINTLDIQAPFVFFLQKSRGTWDNYRLLACCSINVSPTGSVVFPVRVLATFEHVIATKPNLEEIEEWVTSIQDQTGTDVHDLLYGDICFVPEQGAFSLPASATPWMGSPEPVAPAGFVEEYNKLKQIS